MKKKAQAALPPYATSDKKKELEKELTTLRHDIAEVYKKHLSLFKQLLHETIRKDWEKVILNQCYNQLGHVSKGGKRTVPAMPRGLSKTSITTCIQAWLCLSMPSDLAERVPMSRRAKVSL